MHSNQAEEKLAQIHPDNQQPVTGQQAPSHLEEGTTSVSLSRSNEHYLGGKCYNLPSQVQYLETCKIENWQNTD